MLFQLRDAQGLPDFGVALLAEGVEVSPHRALEDKGSLRDDRDALPQGSQAQLQCVAAAQFVVGTCHRLRHPEEHLENGGLARASPAHDCSSLAILDIEADVLEDYREVLSIPHRQTAEFNSRLVGPD